MRALLTALALSTTLALAGCSGSDDEADVATSTSTAPAADNLTTASPETPKDSQRVSTGTVSFAVPAGWEEASADDVAGFVREFADRMGLTPKQLVATFRAVSLLAVSDEAPAKGPRTNVNVVETPVTGDPSQAQIARTLRRNGARPGTFREVTTELGSGLAVDYAVTTQGVRAESQVATLAIGTTAVTITVTAARSAESREILDLALDTLAGPEQ